MRLVIYGSRTLWPTPNAITAVVYERWGVLPSLVISGMAQGADRAGRAWALARGIPVLEMPADWGQFGKHAGYMRNTEMAEKALAGLGFWDGRSRGTAQMTDELRRLKRSCHVVVL